MNPYVHTGTPTNKGSLFVPGSNVACGYDPPSDHSNYTNTVTPAAIVKISKRPRCVSRCNSMAVPVSFVGARSRCLEVPGEASRTLRGLVSLSSCRPLIQLFVNWSYRIDYVKPCDLETCTRNQVIISAFLFGAVTRVPPRSELLILTRRYSSLRFASVVNGGQLG